jgi:hypothetical protein
MQNTPFHTLLLFFNQKTIQDAQETSGKWADFCRFISRTIFIQLQSSLLDENLLTLDDLRAVNLIIRGGNLPVSYGTELKRRRILQFVDAINSINTITHAQTPTELDRCLDRALPYLRHDWKECTTDCIDLEPEKQFKQTVQERYPSRDTARDIEKINNILLFRERKAS